MTEINVSNNLSVESASGAGKAAKVGDSTSNATLPVVQKLTKEELIKKLGITEEQLTQIILKHPTFSNADIVDYVQKMKAGTAETQKTQEGSEVNTEATQEKAVTSEEFRQVSFEKLEDIGDKQAEILCEIAKNNFMFGNPDSKKTLEDWNNLSEEEQSAYINKVLDFLDKNKEVIGKDLKNLDKFKQHALASEIMTGIQAANAAGMSVIEYMKLNGNERESILYNYLKTKEPSDLSRKEKRIFEVDNLQFNAINHYLKQNGKEPVSSLAEAKQYIKENKISLGLIEKNYLATKANLNRYEKTEYERLKDKPDESFIIDACRDHELSDPPSKLQLINKGEHADAFLNSSTREQADIIMKGINNSYKKDDDKAYDELVRCIQDAHTMGNEELEGYLTNALQTRFKKKFINDARAVNEETAALYLTIPSDGWTTEDIHQLQHNMEQSNSDLGCLAMRHQRHVCNDENTMRALTKYQAKNEEVNKANVDMAQKANSPELQLELANNIVQNSGLETREHLADKTGGFRKEIQLNIMESQLADKNERIINRYSNNVNTLDKDNQTAGLKLVKATVADMPEDFAKVIETNLANQIQYCDKDNQLDMHNEIMQSKFSEVQEQAAKNVKNYDASVQSAAIDTVINSKNEKAIKAVYEELSKMPPDVQKNEVVRIIGELALDNAITNNALSAKIMGGNLTVQDLTKLTPQERRTYFLKKFEEASGPKKLEFLMKLSSSMSGIQKKTIYTVIARFSPVLLKGMVDSGMGKEMIEAGLPLDATNKIINLMKASTSNENIKQLKELKKDSAYERYFDDENKNTQQHVSSEMKDLFRRRGRRTSAAMDIKS